MANPQLKLTVLLKSGKSQWFRKKLEWIFLAEAVNGRQKYRVGCCIPMDHLFHSQLPIYPAISCISISCIRWQLCDKGSYTSEIRRFGLDLLWQKWDQNLFSSFSTLETCQYLLDLCLDGDWPGRAGFKKKIKPIRSISRKKKQLFYLLIHTRTPHFSFTEKPKEVIFHSGQNCRNDMKSAFPKDFSQRQMHLESQWQQRAGVLCSPHAPEEEGLHQPWITSEQAMSSCYFQIRVICLSISLSNGAAAHGQDMSALTVQNSLAKAVFDCSITIHFTIRLQNPCGWETQKRIKRASLCEISSKSLK